MPDFRVATRLSLTFFLIGSLLMAMYYFTMSDTVALIGYSYTGFAVLVGMIYLIVIGFKVISKKIHPNTGLKCAGVVLLNLPVAILYLFFVITLLSTARLTIENETGRDLSEVSIGGCTSEELGDLKAGDSKTVWIRIKSDCSVKLFYKMDGEQRHETALPYLTPNMGRIVTHKIGQNIKGF